MRSLVLPAVLALTIVAAACSGGGGSSDNSPKGDHHHYVINHLDLPLTTVLSDEYGFDLDGDTNVDNSLGGILSALVQASGAGSLDFQGGMDTSVATGTSLLLVDLQAPALDDASNVGFSVFHGANPSPAPCSSGADTICGHHLDGTGTFDIAGGFSTSAFIDGKIAASQFSTVDTGDLNLSIDFLGHPIDLLLVSAHATLGGITATTIGPSTLGGAIPNTDVQTKILPAIQVAVQNLVARDCTGTPPPGCGCLGNSSGGTVLSLFDANMDCAVSLSEIQSSNFVSTLFQSDVDTDGDGTADAVSAGVGFTAVAATFAQP